MIRFVLCCCLAALAGSVVGQPAVPALASLFADWRRFEQPPLLNGAPDYSEAAFARRQPAFVQLRQRLQQIDTSSWPLSAQADWMLVWAEMNGYDFNQHILKPWQRDPAFYKVLWTERSDVPDHEGPTNHAIIELWQYQFPLLPARRTQLLLQLRTIPPFYQQAQRQLTGNARDLWVTGIRDISSQVTDLSEMRRLPGVAADAELLQAIDGAIAASTGLRQWLEQQAPSKTGPSGIGKEHYTWYQQNVHLLPMTWDDEVLLLKRELGRAWTALQLEEQRNRHLPPLPEAASPADYARMADSAATLLIRFLDTAGMVTVAPYFDTALRQHLGSYVPPAQRHFFWITAHYDPKPLYSHFYHWFELARIDREPHVNPIRRGALLYNIFDNRNEGVATAVEEWWMQAGLYDQSPRSRELVYILIAQRAARGLGSLYAHANMMNMEEAGGIHSEYTPRGWMKTEPALRIFEQHLYLRQPGYGTSYITGKYLLENLMAEYSRQKAAAKQPFSMRQFMDALNAAGCIPVQLVGWQLLNERNWWLH